MTEEDAAAFFGIGLGGVGGEGLELVGGEVEGHERVGLDKCSRIPFQHLRKIGELNASR
jgi:hypothetical protein